MWKRAIVLLLASSPTACIVQTETTQGEPGAQGETGPQGVSPFSYVDPEEKTDIYYTGGAVGIGTQAPAATLDVVSSSPSPFSVFTSDPVARIHLEGALATVIRATEADATKHISLQVTDTANTGAFLSLFGKDDFGGVVLGAARQSATGAIYLETQGEVRAFIDAEGKIGFGTTAPEAPLHIASTSGELRIQDTDSTADDFNLTAFIRFVDSNGVQIGGIGDGGSTKTLGIGGESGYNMSFATNGVSHRLFIATDGKVGIGTTDPDEALHVNGTVKALGFIPMSSRAAKRDISELRLDHAMAAIRDMRPVRFRYKATPEEEQLGFIAEDVPGLIATNDRKSVAPMDVAAVLTRVVQEQDATIRQQRLLLDKQQRQIDDVLARLQKLEQARERR